jgi:hypothetical protein
MNPAVKAALFNALLFPGWGHFYLKEYKRGFLIIIPFLAGVLSICWAVVQIALSVLRAAPFKEGTVDVAAVFKLSADAMQALNSGYLSLILLFIILLWIFSIVDAYRIGKKRMIRP